MASKQMPNRYRLLVVGCGGTGSAFLQNIVPYLVHRDDSQIKVELIICDGDTVEEKNLARQVFYEDQVGMNKALALSESISCTFGFNVEVIDHYLESPEDVCRAFVPRDRYSYTNNYLPVLIGCVDNLKARAVYEDWFWASDSAIYIDCANEEFRGEVVYASRFNGRNLSVTRSRVFPSFARLLKDEQKTLKFRSEEDCIARSISSPQHIYANKMSGLLAANAVSAMLETSCPPAGVDIFLTRPSLTVRHEDTSSLIPRVSATESGPEKKRVG